LHCPTCSRYPGSSSEPAFPGQARRSSSNQVTYPLATTMLFVPGRRRLRGLLGFFGDSSFMCCSRDDTDLYWARSRVFGVLSNQAAGSACRGCLHHPRAGCHGRGLDLHTPWVAASGQHDLAQCGDCRTGSSSTNSKSLPNVSRSGPPLADGQAINQCCSIRQKSGGLWELKQEVEAALKSASGKPAAPSWSWRRPRVLVRGQAI